MLNVDAERDEAGMSTNSLMDKLDLMVLVEDLIEPLLRCYLSPFAAFNR